MATTINAYSVGLTLDASSYIRNSELSRKETAALRRDIDRARTPAERYTQQVNRLDKAVQQGAIDQATYNRLLADAKRRYHQAADSADRAGSTTGAFATKLGVAAAAYVTLDSAISTASWAIKLAADAEQAQIAYEVLLADTEQAKQLLDDLRGFANVTPFDTAEIRDSGRQLLAMGFAANTVTDTLQVLGTVSAATGSRIGDLTSVVGKMRVQGRIMTEDLNQMTDRNINVLDRLAERFGTTAAGVRDLASEGQIQFSDLFAVLRDLSQEDYAGMLNRQSESLNGQWSTLNSTISETGVLLGELATKQDGLLSKVTFTVERLNDGLNMLSRMMDDGLFSSPAAAGAAIAGEIKRQQDAAAKDMAGLIKDTLTPGDEQGPNDDAERVAEIANQERIRNMEGIAALRFKNNQVEVLSAAFESLTEKQQKSATTMITAGDSYSDIVAMLDEMLSKADSIETADYRQLKAKEEYLANEKQIEKVKRDIAKLEEQHAQSMKKAQEERLRKEEEIRDAIAGGIGSGELSGLASFEAQQANRDIAGRVAIDSRTLGPTESPEEVAELQKLQRQLKLAQDKQTALLEKIADNGFKRIR